MYVCREIVGTFTGIDNQENSETIEVEIKPNMEMSYHSYLSRIEMWDIIFGTGVVCVNSEFKK